MHERRNQVRSTITLDLRLYQDDNLQTLAKAKDITVAGMFIQVDSLLFPKNALIDIVFDDAIRKISYRLPAKVMHRSLHGIGVSFQPQGQEFDIDNFSHLVDFTKVVA